MEGRSLSPLSTIFRSNCTGGGVQRTEIIFKCSIREELEETAMTTVLLVLR